MSEIRCECGKLLAKVDHGSIFVMCKRCKRQVSILEGAAFSADEDSGIKLLEAYYNAISPYSKAKLLNYAYELTILDVVHQQEKRDKRKHLTVVE